MIYLRRSVDLTCKNCWRIVDQFFRVFEDKLERWLELWGLQPCTLSDGSLKPMGLVIVWTQSGLSSGCVITWVWFVTQCWVLLTQET